MVMHARSGGNLEVMGLMLGKVDGETMIIMDSFALPVEGTETRVNAQAAAYEYMAAYIENAKQVKCSSLKFSHCKLKSLMAFEFLNLKLSFLHESYILCYFQQFLYKRYMRLAWIFLKNKFSTLKRVYIKISYHKKKIVIVW